jgi:hypothetical protein
MQRVGVTADAQRAKSMPMRTGERRWANRLSLNEERFFTRLSATTGVG